jgi:hypothetical protein
MKKVDLTYSADTNNRKWGHSKAGYHAVITIMISQAGLDLSKITVVGLGQPMFTSYRKA